MNRNSEASLAETDRRHQHQHNKFICRYKWSQHRMDDSYRHCGCERCRRRRKQERYR